MLVLFVCAGNVGRSQVAEAYFNRFSKRHTAMSAGARYEGDREISPTFRRLLAEEGIEMNKQKPKPLTPDMIDHADRVIVLCSRTDCPVYLLKSNKAMFWSVRETRDAQFEDKEIIKEEIKQNVMKLLDEMEEPL